MAPSPPAVGATFDPRQGYSRRSTDDRQRWRWPDRIKLGQLSGLCWLDVDPRTKSYVYGWTAYEEVSLIFRVSMLGVCTTYLTAYHKEFSHSAPTPHP